MKAERRMAICVMALLSVTAVLAEDIRVVVLKTSQIYCEKCGKKVKDNMRLERGLKDISTKVKAKMVTIVYDVERTNIKKLQAGFNKFSYEAEFIEETKKNDQKVDRK